MRGLQFSLLLTGAVALLAAAYLAASAYSCTAFLEGQLGNCLALAGLDVAHSGVAKTAGASCTGLLLLGIWRRRQG